LVIDVDLLANQPVEIDMPRLALPGEKNSIVQLGLAREALTDTGFYQHLRGPVFHHPGAAARFAIGPAPVFDDDGVDAFKFKKVCEHEAGRTRANNSNLGAHEKFPRKANCDSQIKRVCAKQKTQQHRDGRILPPHAIIHHAVQLKCTRPRDLNHKPVLERPAAIKTGRDQDRPRHNHSIAGPGSRAIAESRMPLSIPVRHRAKGPKRQLFI
jgi:hypothetical protein